MKLLAIAVASQLLISCATVSPDKFKLNKGLDGALDDGWSVSLEWDLPQPQPKRDE